MSALADFVNYIPITVEVISINKTKFCEAIGAKSDNDFKGSAERIEAREFPYRVMATRLFQWVGQYLKSKDGAGQILVDARRGGDYQIIKTLYTCKEESGPLPSEERKLIKDRCTAVCFAEKSFLSGGLEITDLISWASFFYVRRQLSSMDSIKVRRLWASIRGKLPQKRVINYLTRPEIRSFLKIEGDGVYKYFETSTNFNKKS